LMTCRYCQRLEFPIAHVGFDIVDLQGPCDVIESQLHPRLHSPDKLAAGDGYAGARVDDGDGRRITRHARTGRTVVQQFALFAQLSERDYEITVFLSQRDERFVGRFPVGLTHRFEQLIAHLDKLGRPALRRQSVPRRRLDRVRRHALAIQPHVAGHVLGILVADRSELVDVDEVGALPVAVAIQAFSLLVQAQGRSIGRSHLAKVHGDRKAGKQQEQQ
jgi:hypothetical protein